MGWLSEWAYRKRVTLVEQSSGDYTDYPTIITLAHNPHMESDFADCRFTEPDGTTLIPYGIKEKTDGVSCSFIIKRDYTSDCTLTVYLYYGNPDATDASVDHGPWALAWYLVNGFGKSPSAYTDINCNLYPHSATEDIPAWADIIFGGCKANGGSRVYYGRVKINGVGAPWATTNVCNGQGTDLWLKWLKYQCTLQQYDHAAFIAGASNTVTWGHYNAPNPGFWVSYYPLDPSVSFGAEEIVSKDLFARFEVGQGSLDLLARFEVGVGVLFDSEDLLAKAFIQRAQASDLSGRFCVSHWLPGWLKRVRLSVDAGDVDVNHSDFPTLLYLSTASGIYDEDVSFIFDELGGNSKRIALTICDGTTQCYVEIDKWDSGNEKAWLWAKIPTVYASRNTILYLYYDNRHVDNDAYVGIPDSVPAEIVWDSDFKFVSHMRDDPDTSHVRDSTTNDNDGTKVGVNQPAVTTAGQIDDAQNFDGINDWVQLAHQASLDIIGDVTIEVWVNSNASPATFNTIASKYVDATHAPYHCGWLNTRKLRMWTPGGVIDSTDTFTFGVLTHLVVRRDVSESKLYFFFDGVPDSGNPHAYTGAPTASTGAVHIGKHPTGEVYAKGVMDEHRISAGFRSDAWIETSYETGRDHLLDWFSEEIYGEDSEELLGKFTVEIPFSSAELLAEFVVGQDSTSLFAKCVVRQESSANLLSKFVIRTTWLVELLSKLTVGVLASSAELLGEFEVKHSITTELLGKAVIRHIGTPVELLGKTEIRRSGSIEVLGKLVIRPSSLAELLCRGGIRNLASTDVLGILTVRYPASVNLLARSIIRSVDSIDLFSVSEIRNLASADLLGRFAVKHITALAPLCKFTVRHSTSSDLLGKADVRYSSLAELLARSIIRHLTSVDLLGRFEVGQDSRDLFARAEVGQASVDFLARFEVGQGSEEFLGKATIRDSASLNLKFSLYVRPEESLAVEMFIGGRDRRIDFGGTDREIVIGGQNSRMDLSGVDDHEILVGSQDRRMDLSGADRKLIIGRERRTDPDQVTQKMKVSGGKRRMRIRPADSPRSKTDSES